MRALIGLVSVFFATSSHAAGLQWKHEPGYRVATVAVPEEGRTGFSSLPPQQTGIHFTNNLSRQTRMENANLMNGSGVALGDYDGDGLCDIYLCNLDGRNRLYRNLGNWKFEDVTASAGVACPDQSSTGAVFADINGDRRPDLIVTALGGPNALFLNLGGGRFTNVTEASGIASRYGASTAALADVDGNGTIDLYIANYGATSILRSGGALNVTTLPDGRVVVRGRYARRIKVVDGILHELGEPDALYLNDGQGRFKAVSWTDGAFLDEEGKPLLAAPWDQGLTAMFRDINRDGLPDLYVCNDALSPDRCWINLGGGRFRALSPLALRQTSYFSMGVDFGDLDRDGHDDFLVVDMESRQRELQMTQMGLMHSQPKLPGDIETQLQIRRNVLLRARGDGTFAEIAEFANLAGSEWSWSCVFLDVDLDGWEDILVTNGFAHNVEDLDTVERVQAMGQLGPEASRKTYLLYPPLETPNVAFHNQRDLTFREMGRDWGFDSIQISNGMALGDLDNDGDLDVVVNCMNAPTLVYRNESSAPRVAVRLRGNAPNTEGIGARIEVHGGPVPQSQEMIAGGRYVSGDNPMRVFAAGASTNLRIEVTWPGGKRSVIDNAGPNRIYEIEEPSGAVSNATAEPRSREGNSAGQGADTSAGPATNAAPWFEDVSDKLKHVHTEPLFDDFARQPLLHHRLSQLGPGAAWFDYDGDGWDDLVIGTGRGGRLAVYRNDRNSGFAAQALPEAATNLPRDTAGIIGWSPAPGKFEIMAGSSNYEDGRTNGVALLRFSRGPGKWSVEPGLPDWQAGVGALCVADIDSDGDLDLFAGGRVLPGRYPTPVSSAILRNDDGVLRPDMENAAVLERIGMVTGACFSDLDGDGQPDLILAHEWGPVRILLNEG
ncbi:MAG TPA: VCBS repeat-containing protein, partial [Methylomirabilota bacterium]|nr:VCBS repeat-containing protein [Methylomirabilota bacterium]